MRSVRFHNLQADISRTLMNKIYHRKLSKAALLALGFACATFSGWAQETEEEVFELSPFTVDGKAVGQHLSVRRGVLRTDGCQ